MALVLAVASPAEAGAPPRDAIVEGSGPATARISASASAARYPLNDGTGATVAVAVSAACQAVCADADPQQIADLIGGLHHGPEVERLTVQLDGPFQIQLDCGARVSACYFPSQARIVLSGDEVPAADGAGRALVLAHEYGHHLARSRVSPPPLLSPLLRGTPRWAREANVCRLQRAGHVSPGVGGSNYYEDPGEAFAEAYGRLHFPSPGVEWKWIEALRPDEAAFRAIREDALDPWTERTGIAVAGRAPSHGVVVRQIPTPLDGTVTVRGMRPRRDVALGLQNPLGELSMARMSGGPPRSVEYTVCGESRLGVVLRSLRERGSQYRLQVQRP
jgi:hypothetical protein